MLWENRETGANPVRCRRCDVESASNTTDICWEGKRMRKQSQKTCLFGASRSADYRCGEEILAKA